MLVGWLPARAMGYVEPMMVAVNECFEDGGTVRVVTTGAVFVVCEEGMEVWRRIDPLYNDYQHPRLVATLEFLDSPGTLAIESLSRAECVVRGTGPEGDVVRFVFQGDSVVRLEGLAESAFAYAYESLVTGEAVWAQGWGTQRFWTDGYGGSSHAADPTEGKTGAKLLSMWATGMEIELESGEGTVMSVFPPKRFDYQALYDEAGRPHVFICFQGGQMAWVEQHLEELAEQRFGVIVLWHSTDGSLYPFGSWPVDLQPVWGVQHDYWGYHYTDEQAVLDFVTAAKTHERPFKVVAYLHGPKLRQPDDQVCQEVEDTLDFMDAFRRRYHVDGFLLDNAKAGANWLESYEFVRSARARLGNEGLLLHHDTVNVWGGYTGRDFPALNAYMYAVRRGETGPYADGITGPNDPYIRYYICQVGLSNSQWFPLKPTSGSADITNEELFQLGPHLHSVARFSKWMWDYAVEGDYVLRSAYWEGHPEGLGHDLRRLQWAAGTMELDVDYPIGWAEE